MAAIYTVSQLNNEIKDLLDAVPGYRSLLVQGEISNYKAHSSGHHYMTLKDRDAAINAVMFRSDAMRLKFRLENGMEGHRSRARQLVPAHGCGAALHLGDHSGRRRRAERCLRAAESKARGRGPVCRGTQKADPGLPVLHCPRDLTDRCGGTRHDPHPRAALAAREGRALPGAGAGTGCGGEHRARSRARERDR